MRKKIIPHMLHYLAPLGRYVEKGTELDKSTLIQRCAGTTENSVLQILKSLVFFRLGKSSEGELYLV